MTDRPHLALLRMPSWLGPAVTEEIRLDLAPECYEMRTQGQRVRIVERDSGQFVYAGIGPVEIVAAQARADSNEGPP